MSGGQSSGVTNKIKIGVQQHAINSELNGETNLGDEKEVVLDLRVDSKKESYHHCQRKRASNTI